MMSFAQLGNELYTGTRSLNIVTNRRRWLSIAGALAAAGLLILLVKGLNPGIEFSGGSEFRIQGVSTTDTSLAAEVLSDAGVSETPRVSVIGTERDAVRVQTLELTSEQIEQIREELLDAYGGDSISSTFIGPAWGQDVTQRAFLAILVFVPLVALGMSLYFRSWTMALAGICALLHDIIVTVGAYALVGFEVTPASVIGFLTILGYSLYDTVVVFDKVRENSQGFLEQHVVTFPEIADLAVNQTLVRSLNTSITGLLPVTAILVVGASGVGGGTLRDISLALFVGMLVSTISSIFIAAPAETTFRMMIPAYQEHDTQVLAKREASSDIVATNSTTAAALGATVAPGGHKGQQAQPRKKTRKNR